MYRTSIEAIGDKLGPFTVVANMHTTVDLNEAVAYREGHMKDDAKNWWIESVEIE